MNRALRFAGVIGAVFLCSANAVAGMSHKVFQNSPARVFEAGIHVAEKYGTGIAVDRQDQIISFTVGNWALAGTDHLTAFFHGLPDGCGKTKPCTATKVEVKANRLSIGGFWFKTGHGDVAAFFKRLREELKRSSEPHGGAGKPTKGRKR